MLEADEADSRMGDSKGGPPVDETYDSADFVSKLTVLMELKLVVEPDLESAGSLFQLWAHSFEYVTVVCAAFAAKRQYGEDSGWRWSDQILRGNIFVCFVFDW